MSLRLLLNHVTQRPFGAKEAGEGPLLPILPRYVNAVYDAIGIRINDLPLTQTKFSGYRKENES